MTSGEARDDISALPRNAAIKIFSYLGIVDLYNCFEVCRSWKMICNSNLLWSKIDLYPVRKMYLNISLRHFRSICFNHFILLIIIED